MRTKIGKRVLAGFTAFLLGTSTACQSPSAGSSESPSSDPEGASSADMSSETPSQSLPENCKEITVDFAERAGSRWSKNLASLIPALSPWIERKNKFPP